LKTIGEHVPESTHADQLAQLKQVARRLGILRGGLEYEQRCLAFFKGVDLRGKRVLEIGCGRGMLCLWAKIHGASDVIGLEPAGDGFRDASSYYEDFITMTRELGLNNVQILRSTIQSYDLPSSYFDIVVSFASINHLDEPSCIDLRRSAAARENYIKLFRHIRSGMAATGKFLIADASERSFFDDCKLKNPFNPHIERFKHQSPHYWAQLLSAGGFQDPRISWLSGTLFTCACVGRVPRLISYFHSSAFRLEVSCAPV